MSKKPQMDMAAFLGSAAPSTSHTPVPAVVQQVVSEAPKRAPGRPKKAADDIAKQTAIRLDPDDLKKVKKLAVDDGMTFNRVVYLALEAYCETRGVKLLGASKR